MSFCSDLIQSSPRPSAIVTDDNRKNAAAVCILAVLVVSVATSSLASRQYLT